MTLPKFSTRLSECSVAVFTHGNGAKRPQHSIEIGVSTYDAETDSFKNAKLYIRPSQAGAVRSCLQQCEDYVLMAESTSRNVDSSAAVAAD